MKRLLFQLDGDRLPSAFDRVVGHDAGADEVLSYGGVGVEDVRALVHGAMFTRGPKELRHTALFIGGSDTTHAEQLLAAVRATFFGPFHTSVMLDPNGCNTTAAAAVWKAAGALNGAMEGRQAVVLAGTGPVGARVAGLLGGLGARVRITSRTHERGEEAARRIQERFGVEVQVHRLADPAEAAEAIQDAEVVIACGSAGVQLLPLAAWRERRGPRVLADINAVPPVGIEGVEPTDDGRESGETLLFGALAIGGLKMKLHKASIQRLFASNDQLLDAETIYDLARTL